MSPDRRAFFNSAKAHSSYVAAIRSCFGKDELGPAFTDELDRRVAWQLASVAGVHLTEQSDRVQDRLCSRSGVQSEHVQQLGRVAAQCRVYLSDAVQEVEIFRLCELLSLRNAGGELVPRQDRFYSSEGISAILLGLEQSLTTLPYSRTLSLIAFPSVWNRS